MFDQVQEAGVSGVRRYFGAKCEANSRPLWNMAPGGTYKFLGEVKFRDFIQGVGNIQDISENTPLLDTLFGLGVNVVLMLFREGIRWPARRG